MRVCQFRHPGWMGRAETLRTGAAPVNASRGGFHNRPMANGL